MDVIARPSADVIDNTVVARGGSSMSSSEVEPEQSEQRLMESWRGGGLSPRPTSAGAILRRATRTIDAGARDPSIVIRRIRETQRG